MAQIINTNISALNAQRNLNKSQNAGMSAMQRLSSGLRINSAKDDAAGLGISDRMTTQIRGQNQAVRNANDGISLVQTGDSALAEMTNNLQRIRELAVQSSNITNTAADRAAIDLEVQQRLAELDRTASTTSFNGQKLLNGSLGSATFQIGANAGENISLSLDSSTDLRIAAAGKVATVTSTTLGATKTDGSVTTGTVTPANFSLGDPLQQWGHNTLTAATHLFGNVVSAGTPGTTDLTTIVPTDFTTAGAIAGVNVQAAPTDLTFSGAANEAQFNVTDGVVNASVTLNQNYANAAAMAADIQTQLNNGGFTTATVTIDPDGQFVFTNDVGVANAMQVTTNDANALAAGFANSAGLAGAATNAATFTVDGIAVNLNANYTNQAGVATAIQTQLNATGNYTVSVDGAGYKIINNVIGSTSPNIVATNAAAYGQGWDTGASNTTLLNGTPAVSANNATFQVDTYGINLDQNYADFDAMAADIKSQLDNASGGTAYTVTNTNGSINITKTGSTAAVAITAPTANVAIDNPGVLNDFTPTAASNATSVTTGFGPSAGVVGTTAVSFKVDGSQVILNSNNATNGDLVTDVQGALDTKFGAGVYLAEANGAADGFKISKVNSAAAVAITADDTAGYDGTIANAAAAGIVPTAGVAGVSAGVVALTDLKINGTSMAAGSPYANVQALADKINADVSGVYATVTSGTLNLRSATDIKLEGAVDTAAMGGTFGVTTIAANSGNMHDIDTLTVEGSMDTILRVDNALNAVTSLRSTFGAVQNRFESVIANLQSTSENLTAARSRIQDADFAAESAELSRTQVLQQAGTAMLAQANQSSQGVMALLR